MKMRTNWFSKLKVVSTEIKAGSIIVNMRPRLWFRIVLLIKAFFKVIFNAN